VGVHYLGFSGEVVRTTRYRVIVVWEQSRVVGIMNCTELKELLEGESIITGLCVLCKQYL